VRSIAPDANPYLALYALLRTGLEGPMPEDAETEIRRARTRFLPDNIYDAIRHFKSSDFVGELLGADVQAKYAEVKQLSADRCPKALGSVIKTSEVQFHHEVTNQYLWSRF
jgi:glutamine synthetase